MILAENVEKLTFNFSGKSYKVNRKQIEELYPNYDDIVSNEINKNNFNKYLENKMNDNDISVIRKWYKNVRSRI